MPLCVVHGPAGPRSASSATPAFVTKLCPQPARPRMVQQIFQQTIEGPCLKCSELRSKVGAVPYDILGLFALRVTTICTAHDCETTMRTPCTYVGYIEAVNCICRDAINLSSGPICHTNACTLLSVVATALFPSGPIDFSRSLICVQQALPFCNCHLKL